MTHSLYRPNKMTKRVYNNKMNSIQLYYKINAIFMNSESSKISHPHRLLVNFAHQIILKRSDKYVALSNLDICYT